MLRTLFDGTELGLASLCLLIAPDFPMSRQRSPAIVKHVVWKLIMRHRF
jgi:hypothetical protein